ncbi:MAG: hypothetical protein JST23_10700 [Bacteroidetes bacterium]|nr:hypothetical protein [Bacteroidota bacterium]
MKNFEPIKAKYLALGISIDNIDFAIDSVREGTKREITLETLTADYRGMTESQATQLLEDLYTANGGEFKTENRGGYLYGTLLCLVGIICVAILIGMLISGEGKTKFIILTLCGALFGLIQGPVLIIKSMRGKFRDADSPFNN